MRNLRYLDAYRIDTMATHGYAGDESCGGFRITSKTAPNQKLVVVASSGMGWDHVSVSLKFRCPTWAEMEQIKHLFFGEDEIAIQLHVPAGDHISHHPFTLHLWRPLDVELPRPPGWMVGPKGTRCPRCGSPHPAQHPAKFTCPDPWHVGETKMEEPVGDAAVGKAPT